MIRKKSKGDVPTLWEKAKSKFGWGIYSARIAISQKLPKPKKKKEVSISGRKLKNKLFVYVMLLLPLIQFSIFYIGVNFNSILMVFQYNYNGTYYFNSNLFQNFIDVWDALVSAPYFSSLITNSLLSFAIIQLMSPIILFFTFFIYKKFVGYKFFKIVLFLPTIISTLITITVYKQFCNVAIPAFFKSVLGIEMQGLLNNFENAIAMFWPVMFYNMWLSFGSLMLMYLGAMNGISESIVESCKLEGANSIQEFWYITFPMIYPTFATLFYTSVATIFTNQIHLYSLWGNGAPKKLWTFGYYLYNEVASDTMGTNYPFTATVGILMTLIAAPLTFVIKWALNKIGPSVE